MISAIIFATLLASAEAAPLRQTISLDDRWQIAEGKLDAVPAKFEHTVVVPGLVDMAQPAFEAPGSTVPAEDREKPWLRPAYQQREAFWYRRTFTVEGPVPAVAKLKVNKARYGTKVILNGQVLGEHGFYNKMWMYEESLHLPLIVRLPAGKPGVNDELVGMLDIAPTILDLAGATIPADIQGKSLLPLLNGTPAGWRDAFYYHYYGTVAPPRYDNWIAFHEILGLRTKTAKLVCYPTWKGGPFWEFFDLAKDPHEMNNLFAEPSQQKIATDMKRRLRAFAEQYQDAEAVAMLDALIKNEK